MRDQTVNSHGHHVTRVPRAEFKIYFALILMIAVPVQLVAWTGEAVIHAKKPRLDPLTRAWKDSTAITPMTFRG
ncbi:MAG: protein pufQ [Proteobacteria bacterium]|nr:protein pufQ [Pseudomonadota bacterium]